jgi:lipoate-protein ligase A
MSSENQAETEERSDTTDTRGRIETLEAHLSPDNPIIAERLSTVRARVTEYEKADSESDEQDALDKIETELEEVRKAVEQEVDRGKETAHDLLDDLEEAVSNLRK